MGRDWTGASSVRSEPISMILFAGDASRPGASDGVTYLRWKRRRDIGKGEDAGNDASRAWDGRSAVNSGPLSLKSIRKLLETPDKHFLIVWCKSFHFWQNFHSRISQIYQIWSIFKPILELGQPNRTKLSENIVGHLSNILWNFGAIWFSFAKFPILTSASNRIYLSQFL